MLSMAARLDPHIHSPAAAGRRYRPVFSAAGPCASPTTRRRKMLSVAVPLLLLPWRGCDQGGNYSTGVTGICHPIYQPAAAAEKQFSQQQRQQQQAAAAAQPSSTATPPLQAAATAREEKRTLLKEQQAYERVAMEAEQQQRTSKLVDSMWQSLE